MGLKPCHHSLLMSLPVEMDLLCDICLCPLVEQETSVKTIVLGRAQTGLLMCFLNQWSLEDKAVILLADAPLLLSFPQSSPWTP